MRAVIVPLFVACATVSACRDDALTCIDPAGCGAADLGDAADQPPAGDLRGACGLTINEIQTYAANGDVDEFVELYDSCAAPLELDGMRLVYRAAEGVTDVPMVTFGAEAIGAGGFVVCAHDLYSGHANVRFDTSLSKTGGAVALRDALGGVLDAVGWGTATNAFVEKRAAPPPTATTSLQRLPDGYDRDDNGADFALHAPTPGSPNH